jgi:predicted RND superfamily exporter protein
MESLLGLLTRRPGWVVLATLAITLLFLSRIIDFQTGQAHLRVDPSTRTLLPEGDESQAFYDRVQRQFGIRETLLLVLVMDDVFTPENLKLVKSVTQRVGEVDGVQRVVSLANAPNVRTLDDEIEIVPFLEELPRDTDAAEQIRADLEANPIYVGSLVSHDSRAAALVVHLREMPEQEFIDEAIDTKIVQVAIEASGDADVWLTGPPHVKAETSRLIIASLSKILPISFAIMAAIGLLAFRSLRGMLVPISTVLIALVWTLGAVAWLGVPLNLVSTIVPPLLLTVGFAYVVHVVSDYYRSLREDPERLASSGGPAGWALRHVALPVALTGVTTVAGFLSLTISPFPAVREFGWISMLGVAITVLLSLSFAPAALELFGTPTRPAPTVGTAGRLFDRQLERLGRFDVRHRVPILFGGALLAMGSLVSMNWIEVNTDLISNFKADHPVRRHFEAINENLQGAMPLEIVLEADRRSLRRAREPAHHRIASGMARSAA